MNDKLITAAEQAGRLFYGILLKCLSGEGISKVDIGMALWETHLNLKKGRVEKLSNTLQRKAEGLNIPITEEDLNSEAVLDAFESIVRKVASTRQEGKINFYANILIKQIISHDEHEFFMKFVNLVDELSLTQIEILGDTEEITSLMNDGIMGRAAYQRYLGYTSQKYDMMSPDQKKSIKLGPNGEYPVITESGYAFLLLELQNKGLIDVPLTYSDNIFDRKIYVSDIGKEFLKFIKDYSEE